MLPPLAIQSYCLRHFKSIPSLIQQLKATGSSGLELWEGHGHFDQPAGFAELIRQFKEAAVQLVAIGVVSLTGQVEKDRPNFDFCRAAGIKYMSVAFSPATFFERFSGIEALAQQYDLKLGIHNHGAHDWLGNAESYGYVLSRASDRLGLHLDTAWALDASDDPVKLVGQFGPRIFGIHLKDIVFDRSGQCADVILGQGNLDLPALMGALKKINFTGPLVVEYEADEENPVPALRQCIAAVENWR